LETHVDVATATAFLEKLADSTRGIGVEVGEKGNAPHHFAYLKLTSSSELGSYALISTPGERWFELEVTGGFYTGTADDLATDEEVHEYLEDYFTTAAAYLAGNWSAAKSKLFRRSLVVIRTDRGPVTLHR
jgi:hypothetical protein